MAEAGQEVSALDSRVTVRPDLLLFWNAFAELDTCRAIGFGGSGPIPFTAVDAWAARRVVSGAAFDRLTRLVGRMDRAAMDYQAKKAKTNG